MTGRVRRRHKQERLVPGTWSMLALAGSLWLVIWGGIIIVRNLG
jgi:hypothetical protein